jgi:chromosome segregation ATPase
MPAPTLGRVAELERSLEACRRENGQLRSRHAAELARNVALTSDLHAREMTVAHLDRDLSALRAENARLVSDLATARAVPTRVGA